MAVRTTVNQVKALFDSGEFANEDLTPFIEAASALVDEHCVTDTGYSTEKLERIERWLAAHMFTIMRNRVRSESAGDASVSYAVTTGLMLASSMYGQTAMMLDNRGGLAAASKAMETGQVRNKVGVSYLGDSTPKDYYPY